MPEEDTLQQSSRVSSVQSSARGRRPSAAGAGLSEKMLMDRQQSAIGSSGPASTIDRSQPAPRRARADSVGGGSSIGEEKPVIRANSVSGSLVASSAGTALSDASHGQPPFVDPVAKVQRLQRSRLHGRFQREARVQRRWDELREMATTMHQQQLLAQKAGQKAGA